MSIEFIKYIFVIVKNKNIKILTKEQTNTCLTKNMEVDHYHLTQAF